MGVLPVRNIDIKDLTYSTSVECGVDIGVLAERSWSATAESKPEVSSVWQQVGKCRKKYFSRHMYKESVYTDYMLAKITQNIIFC